MAANPNLRAGLLNIGVECVGTYAFMQHTFPESVLLGLLGINTADASRKIVKDERRTTREIAAECLKLVDGKVFHPSRAVTTAMATAGKNHKLKGISARSVAGLVPGAVIAEDDLWPILNADSNAQAPWEVDLRPGKNQNTGQAIACCRPRFEHWRITGVLQVDTTILPITLVQTLLEDAGRRVGIGAFRPECGGPFGRFRVTKFQEI